MSKGAKIGITVTVILLALVTGVVLFFVLRPQPEAQSIMECSVNPEMQLVLDKNNKVMSVNCMDKEAEIVASKVKFEGKTADEAAKLFVEVSTELGYIKVEKTGTKVDITLYSDAEVDLTEISDKIKNKVNGYFDDIGVIAGAVVTKSTEVADQLKKLGANAEEIAGKTADELIAMYQETSEEFKGIALEKKAQFEAAFTTAAKNAEILAKKAKVSAEEAVKKAEDTLSKAEKTLNDIIDNSSLSGEAKEAAKDAANKSVEAARATLKAAKEVLKSAEQKFNEAKKTFEDELKITIDKLREESKQAFEEAKKEYDTRLAEYKKLIETHEKATEAAIKAYRDTLEQA